MSEKDYFLWSKGNNWIALNEGETTCNDKKKYFYEWVREKLVTLGLDF